MIESQIGKTLVNEVSHFAPNETVARIKDVTTKELERLDPTANVRHTNYFNHTNIPDMILSWKDNQIPERYVYIRLSDNVTELSDDVKCIQEFKPFVVPIMLPTQSPSQIATLAHQAVKSDTLVSNLDGINTLATSKAGNPFNGIFGAAISRGGRGLLATEEARSAATILAAGFQGARNLTPDTVGKATELTDALLQPKEAVRVNRFLEALWLGSGGRADLFPHTISGESTLEDDSWRFILDLNDIDDLDFWYRIGTGISLEQLIRVGNPRGKNLHNLVKALSTKLAVGAFKVVQRKPTIPQDMSLFEEPVSAPIVNWQWLIEEGLLTLQAPDFPTYVAGTKPELDSIKNETKDGLNPVEYRDRSKNYTITHVAGQAGSADFRFDDNDGNTLRQLLDTLESTPGTFLRVKRAKTLIRGSNHAEVDFTDDSFSTGTKSRIPLKDYLSEGLPLLRSLSNEEHELLQSCFHVPIDTGTLPLISLFDNEL